jgi:hypothetical protein
MAFAVHWRMMVLLPAQRTGTNANRAHWDQVITMKEYLHILKPTALAAVRSTKLNALGALSSSSPSPLVDANLPGTIAEHLMPYATAAKAIFVKANGLPAYYKATGTVAYTYARQPQAERRRHTDI